MTVIECMCESVSGNGNKNGIESDGRVQVREIGNEYENASDWTKD